MSGVEDEWRRRRKAWDDLRIAEDIIVESPRWCGRMVVDDITEDRHTTTYTLRSLDGEPPFALGMLREEDTEEGAG